MTRWPVLLVALAVLAGPAWAQAPRAVGAPRAEAPSPRAATEAVADAGDELLDDAGFLMASPGRELVLPEDHGSHPRTRTEWWYLTGALTAEDGERFGFQATWFRRALTKDVADGRSPLAVRDVILFHGALTDVAGGRQLVTELASRAYSPWAHAREGVMDVALFEHRLSDESGEGRRARAEFGAGEARLLLDLELASHAPLLHGREPGLSIKGVEPGQASWYYSLPRIGVSGVLERPGRPPTPVTGQAWFDHEFGSSQLGPEQTGWDWFSVALDDGTDLMLYVLRRADGTADVTSAGTLRRPDGTVAHLDRDAFAVAPVGAWTSPRTGATYPSGWRLAVPSERLVVDVSPVLADQELSTPTTTGVTYWEGLCAFEGERSGAPVAGEGYVELVGYAAPITDRFARRDPGP